MGLTMKKHSFKINNKSVTFHLNTKSKQWHIGDYSDPIIILSKAKGDTVIKFLELMQERFSGRKLEVKKTPHSS